jgi:hypothetical protein
MATKEELLEKMKAAVIEWQEDEIGGYLPLLIGQTSQKVLRCIILEYLESNME